jgi:hypothetical protein
MAISKSARTDMVINMTLAEIFLLLLFFGWLWKEPIDPSAENTVLKDKIGRLEKQIDSIKINLKIANDEIKDLNKRLDWWRSISPQLQSSELLLSPTEAKKEMGRGSPKCQDDNLLINVTIIRGEQSIVWITKSPTFTKWIENTGRVHPLFGVRISEKTKIYEFLKLVKDFYEYNKKNGSKCRFDYSLNFDSDSDYYLGRTLYEEYFYAAEIKRIGAKNN